MKVLRLLFMKIDGLRHIPGLYILENEKDRSVFTSEDINKGDVIEVCPVIRLSDRESKLIHKTILHDYYFVWPEGGTVLALGYGSIYNHSDKPNAEVVFEIDTMEMMIRCIKHIDPGDEILIDYTGGTDEVDLWFKPV